MLLDAKGQRLRADPIEVKEGGVMGVAFGPGGTITAGYSRDVVGGVVLLDARGSGSGPTRSRSRRAISRPWPSARGAPSPRDISRLPPAGSVGGGGVVLLDAKGERLRADPIEVKEGGVMGVAFDSGGTIAAGYSRFGVGGGGGGVVLLDAKGERLRADPIEVKEGGVRSVAFGPGGTIAAGYSLRNVAFGPGGIIVAGYSGVVGGGVVLLDAKGERLWADPIEVKEGGVSSVAFDPGGTIAAGYSRGDGGGVVLLDGDPASWRAKAGQVANRNFTRGEWRQFFPETPYRRTIRSLPWPHDLPEAEWKQAEAFEKEHPEGSDAS